MKETMLNKIKDRSLIIGVVGLGYVGLPLIVEKAKAGFKCIGFDVQQEKVDMVNAGKNYIGDVVDAELSDFDISKDIGLKVEPAVFNDGNSKNLNAVGFQCSLKF